MANNKSVDTIIHAAAASAAAVGGGLAQIPGADMPVICGIQTTMIFAIGVRRGADITEAAAADLLMTFAAGYGGRALSQWAVGWIPGWGNAINASTAGALTLVIGRAADDYFNNEEYRAAA
jgi:uncharacterized protein (DUF697 family)